MDNEERKEEAQIFNQVAGQLRGDIETLKARTKAFLHLPALKGPGIVLDGANIPETMQANMAANITLAFRALEDARMRIGKAMQANQGGISIFDRAEGTDAPANQEESSGSQG